MGFAAKAGGFGNALREERVARGITLEDISTTTKISVRMLQAIEGENFDRLPGGVFNINFVRQYARHVGLDDEEVVAEYQRLTAPPVEPEAGSRRTETGAGYDWDHSGESSVWMPATVVVLMLGLCGALYLWFSARKAAVQEPAVAAAPQRSSAATPAETPAPSPTAQTEAPSPGAQTPPATQAGQPATQAAAPGPQAAVPGPQVTQPAPQAVAPGPQAAQPTSRAAVPGPQVTQPASQTAAPGPQTAQPTSRAAAPGLQVTQPASQAAAPGPRAAQPTSQAAGLGPQPSATPPAKPVEPPPAAGTAPVLVELRANDTVWVAITVDGQLGFQGTLRPDQTRQVAARAKVRLRVGDAGALNVTLNGQPQPPLGSKGQVRTVELTPEGLRIVPPPPREQTPKEEAPKEPREQAPPHTL